MLQQYLLPEHLFIHTFVFKLVLIDAVLIILFSSTHYFMFRHIVTAIKHNEILCTERWKDIVGKKKVS